MDFDFDAVVVGAGVVGLACARALSTAGCSTLIIERHSSFGTETSSRNSEVIHAGLYYPKNSLKAKLCVEGKQLLYEFCEYHHVDHKQTGKLIIASSESQISKLEDIQRRAKENSVDDLHLLSKAEVAAIEPAVSCVRGLLSPSTGIVDSHGLMLALLGDAERRGAIASFRSNVSQISRHAGGFAIAVDGDEATIVTTRYLVNAAGLSAAAVAATIEGLDKLHIPPLYLAKGTYFSFAGNAPFSRLVYPVPEPGGLGVHFTIDLSGQGRFGPDVEWVDEVNYEVDPRRSDRFYESIRKYWPNLPDGTLSPTFSGIRPKLSPAGSPDSDFLIQTSEMHGIAGLVNLFGIESPGLTGSLAIAEYTAEKLTRYDPVPELVPVTSRNF